MVNIFRSTANEIETKNQFQIEYLSIDLFTFVLYLHAESNSYAHAMIHNHDVQEPSMKIQNIVRKGWKSF